MSDHHWPRCAPQECHQLDERTKRRSRSLSSTILDYYNRYGQNRDLEKYFRYRKHHHGRSSSDDSSIAPHIVGIPDEKSASASNLSAERDSKMGQHSARNDRKTVSENELANKSKDSKDISRNKSQDQCKNTSGEVVPNQDVPSKGLNLQVSDSKKSSGRKSSCSMKSKIEINITNLDLEPKRSAGFMPWLDQSTGTQTTIQGQKPQCVNAEMQSENIEQYKTPEKIELPKSVKFVDPATEELPAQDVTAASFRPTSANSSIISMGMPNKPRLEWDSLGDVGYDKSGSSVAPIMGPQHMSTLERATLRKFFAERGLKFDENFTALSDPNLLSVTLREAVDQNETRFTDDAIGTAADEVKKEDVEDVIYVVPIEEGVENSKQTQDVIETVPAPAEVTPVKLGSPLPDATIRTLFQHADASTPVNHEHKCSQTRRLSFASKEVQIDSPITTNLPRASVETTNKTPPEVHEVEEAKNTSVIAEIPRRINDIELEDDFDSKTSFEYIDGAEKQTGQRENPQQDVNNAKQLENNNNCENIKPAVEEANLGSRRNSTGSTIKQQEHRQRNEKSIGSNTRSSTNLSSIPLPPDTTETKPLEVHYKNEKPTKTTSSSGCSKQPSSSENSWRSALQLKEKNSTSRDKPLQQKLQPQQHHLKTSNVPEVDTFSTDAPPKPYERTTSKQNHFTASADDTSKYDTQTSEIIQTILCSTTSNQSTTMSSTSAVSPTNDCRLSKSLILNDLKRGIDLLDSLVESEKLSKATKKRLVKKIVKGLLKAKYNISSSTSISTSTQSVNPVESPELSRISRENAASRTSHKSPADVTLKALPSSRMSHPLPSSQMSHRSPPNQVFKSSPASGMSQPASPPFNYRPPLKAKSPRKLDNPTALTKTENRSMQWLKPMTKSEVDYERRKQIKKATKESVKLEWIQKEIQQLVAIQNSIIKKQKHSANRPAPAESTSLNPIYENCSRFSTSDEYYCVVNKNRNSSTSTYASTKNSDSGHKMPAKHREKTKYAPINDESSDSPLVVQAFIRNRTRLRTPEEGSDALGTYARSKQKNFLKQYQSSQEKLARDLIYARPYGDPYMGQGHRLKPSSAKPQTNASSSNTFLSSDSVSIPDMPSSFYPEKQTIKTSVAIQTSDSLARNTNTPLPKSIPVTPILDPPPPISYTITFTRPDSSADLPNNDPTTSTMRDYLNLKKPTFIAHAEARRQCIRDINELRRKRNEQRQKMFLLSEDVNELRTNMEQLQPLPLTQRRVFSTRQLKAATRQRYDKLPEIQAKEDAQKRMRIRFGQRLMRDIFNRDLQRRALRGRINLSNSMTVTTVNKP